MKTILNWLHKKYLKHSLLSGRINAGIVAVRDGSKIKLCDFFCSGRFLKNIMLGLYGYKKGHKRCSYGHWFVIWIRWKVRDYWKRQPKKGGGRIWLAKGGLFCRPSCVIRWWINTPNLSTYTQLPNTARINHTTSIWYLCTFITRLLKDYLFVFVSAEQQFIP